MSHILVVEDDRDIADLIKHYLERAGHTTQLLESGAEVGAAIRRRPPDLLVLDLMLPGLDGLEICRALRADASTSTLPIIVVTARAGETDRVVGLEIGADDYVTKPFSPKELVARIGALLRRAARPPADAARALQYGTLVLDPERHLVLSDGRTIRLTAKEFLLLQYLMERRGRVVSRDRLLTDVWGYSYTGSTRTVDVHVRRLREKLPLLVHAIETVKQFGYKLKDLQA